MEEKKNSKKTFEKPVISVVRLFGLDLFNTSTEPDDGGNTEGELIPTVKYEFM